MGETPLGLVAVPGFYQLCQATTPHHLKRREFLKRHRGFPGTSVVASVGVGRSGTRSHFVGLSGYLPSGCGCVWEAV